MPDARALRPTAADIKAEALRLGFDRVGIARARALPAGGDLRRWLADGRHGTMGYMAKDPEARADPAAAIPGAASVISLAISYAGAGPAPAGSGQVARYARGADYHDVFRRRLQALREFIQRAAPGAIAWWDADTGPVMEKPWAQEAGIGWIGKNTNVIHEHAGSWLLLGEIVTDLELDADPPAMDHCGSCTRCLEACPTGALTAAGEIDARLCISYLTIEHRGPIDEPLRAKMGTWVFGCDVCQEVCPWNGEAPAGREPAFAARPGLGAPDLVAWLRMSAPEYREVTRGTAVRRAKHFMLRRNAAIALGNLGDPAARPALEEAARDGDPLVAEHARWALGRLEKR